MLGAFWIHVIALSMFAASVVLMGRAFVLDETRSRTSAYWALIVSTIVSLPLTYDYAVRHWSEIGSYRTYLQVAVLGMKLVAALAVAGLILEKRRPELSSRHLVGTLILVSFGLLVVYAQSFAIAVRWL